MNKLSKSAKATFIFFLVILLLPLFQHAFKPVFTHGLDGAFPKPEEPSVSLALLLSQQERDKVANWVKFKFGFMPDFVRLRNQINYSLFGEVNALLTLGKEEVIFDPNYIHAYTGVDEIAADSMQKMLFQFKVVFDSIKAMDKQAILLVTPNKAEFYKNYLPDNIRQPRATNNKLNLLNGLDSLKIPHINFNKFLINSADTASYPLIPKHAAHWSYYGAFLAMDSLFSWINSATQSDYRLNLNGLEITNEPKYPDADYNGAMNLILKFPEDDLAYPNYTLETSHKLKLLFIGDSFFWNWSHLGITQQAFDSNSLYFYYNRTVYNMNRDKLGPLKDELALKAFQEADVIIFLVTPPNIKNMLPEIAAYWETHITKI